MIKKRRAYKFIIIPLCLILAIILLFKTISKYASTSTSTGNIEVAFYVLNTDYQTMNINLTSMSPRTEPYVYTFAISNNNGRNRTETALEYDLNIRATTNLPLEYELFLNENYDDNGATNIIQQNIVQADEDGTYFRKITTQTNNFGFTTNQTNIYNLVIYFPVIYKSIEYQNIIEGLEITIDSRQILE